MSGRLDSHGIDSSILHPPYDVGNKALQEGKQVSDLLDTVGIHALNIAKTAALEVGDNTDPFIYVHLCEQAAVRTAVGMRLRPIVDKLDRGEDIDVAHALEALGKLETGHREFTPANEIQPETAIYVPSYYLPLDTYVGGYPIAGLTIVAGVTGTGKTTFLIELARSCARSGHACAVLTLEMTSGQLLYRMLEVDPNLTEEEKSRILLSDSVYDVDGAYAAISRLVTQRELQFIGIDYADMLVGTKEQSEQTMGRVYNTLAVLAKKVRVPIILVAQYRRTDGTVPTIEDIRYSGRAEQAASLILLLYNPDMVFSRSTMNDSSNPLPHSPGCAWIVVGKTRYRGAQPTALGAIKVDWNGQEGWGMAAGREPWFNLVGKI